MIASETLASTVAAVKSLEDKVAALTTDIATTRTALTEAQNDLSAAVAQADALTAEKTAAQQKIAQLLARIAELESGPIQPGAAESPEGTIVRRGETGYLSDSAGGRWTIDAARDNGRVLLNGQLFRYSGNVRSIEMVAHKIRQTNDTGGKWDAVGTDWVQVTAPLPVEPPRLHLGPHYMLSDLPDNATGQQQAPADVRFMRSVGQTYAMVFTDSGISKEWNALEGEMYGRRMQWMLNAGAAEGVPMIPMMQGSNSPGAWADFFKRTLDHPAILRRDGRAVVAVWNWKKSTDAAIAYARKQYGKPVEVFGSFDWGELMLPELHDDQETWEFLPELIKAHGECDGWLNFAVNKNFDNPLSAADRIIRQNRNLVKFCGAAGKLAIPGIVTRYRNVVLSQNDVGRIADDIAQLKPGWVSITSANDWGETGINRETYRPLHTLILSRLAPLLSS